MRSRLTFKKKKEEKKPMLEETLVDTFAPHYRAYVIFSLASPSLGDLLSTIMIQSNSKGFSVTASTSFI